MYTNIIPSEPEIAHEECKENLKQIYNTITSQYLGSKKINNITDTTPYDIHLSEQALPPHMRTKLPKLRANKSPLLQSYLHTASRNACPPQCPLRLTHTHNTNHLFNCSQVLTQHHDTSQWKRPLNVTKIIQEWKSRLVLRFEGFKGWLLQDFLEGAATKTTYKLKEFMFFPLLTGLF